MALEANKEDDELTRTAGDEEGAQIATVLLGIILKTSNFFLITGQSILQITICDLP